MVDNEEIDRLSNSLCVLYEHYRRKNDEPSMRTAYFLCAAREMIQSLAKSQNVQETKKGDKINE